jgi:hypothetical protein
MALDTMVVADKDGLEETINKIASGRQAATDSQSVVISVEDLAALTALATKADSQISLIGATNTKLDGLQASANTLDGRVDGLETGIGVTSETAASTDTATAGLNGRLQRIAQRITSLMALLPTALGSSSAATSLAVTASTEDVARVGIVTETAPATDTASSGMNGRLQRIAQRLTALIALVPASLGAKAAASSFAVTHSTEDAAQLGGLTETAPASDTASSGLNGRLQRIAQRITSLMALVPASLGSKAAASSFAVTLSTENAAVQGAVSDAAWTTGDGSHTALLKAIAGAAVSTTPAIVTNEAPSWTYIAASTTDTAAGNANDLLDSLLVIPATTSPGAVSIEDGAGTNYTLFAGGASSVTTLIPFPIDLRNIAAGTAWEITTGTSVAVIVFYRART